MANVTHKEMLEFTNILVEKLNENTEATQYFLDNIAEALNSLTDRVNKLESK